MDSNLLQTTLSQFLLRIKFTKKNGEIRQMYCTTCPKHLPKELAETRERNVNRKRPAGLVTAFDLDKNEWRSFYSDKVFEYEICHD